MNVLLAYTSKSGTTEECMDRLERELSGLSVTRARLDSESPRLADYDIVVLGGPIRFGKLSKPVRAFCKAHEQELCRMPHALFLCCGLAHDYEYYIERAYSDALRQSAFLVLTLGGTLNYQRKNFFEKMFIHSMRTSIRESEIEDYEYTPEMPVILPENIGKLASYIREEVKKKK